MPVLLQLVPLLRGVHVLLQLWLLLPLLLGMPVLQKHLLQGMPVLWRTRRQASL